MLSGSFTQKNNWIRYLGELRPFWGRTVSRLEATDQECTNHIVGGSQRTHPILCWTVMSHRLPLYWCCHSNEFSLCCFYILFSSDEISHSGVGDSLLLVEVRSLWRLKDKNFLRPIQESVALRYGLLMMYNWGHSCLDFPMFSLCPSCHGKSPILSLAEPRWRPLPKVYVPY